SEAAAITDVDGKLVRLAEEMVHVMYAAPGIGLAAPQIGVQKQMFVYDIGEGPATIVNPRIEESSGEWVYEEGCLSIPGLYVEMVRPKEVLMSGWDLDGNEVSIEADEILARLFQHELDHLHGVLMFDRMTPEQRKAALTEYRRLQETPDETAGPPRRRRLRLP
ncbi:MAG TPA: peptide deformylase, partial [Ilumatobacteraceae bacterium]